MYLLQLVHHMYTLCKFTKQEYGGDIPKRIASQWNYLILAIATLSLQAVRFISLLWQARLGFCEWILDDQGCSQLFHHFHSLSW